MTARSARLVAALGVCLSIGGLLFLASKAQAQECTDLSTVVDRLKERYGEEIVWSGVNDRGDGTIRSYLFQSPNKTWTLVVGQGTAACVISSGKDATPVVPGRDA